MPVSVTRFWINFGGVLCYLAFALVAPHFYPGMDAVSFALGAIVVTAIPIAALEVTVLKTYRRLNLSRRVPDKERIRIKVTGLYGTVILLFIGYLLLPEYAKPFYAPYWKLCVGLGLAIFAVGFVYIEVSERWLPSHKDGLWCMGCLLGGRWSEVNRTVLAEHWRGWLIKAYFLPLMFSYLVALYRQFQVGELTFSSFYIFPHHTVYNTFFLNGRSLGQLGINDAILVAIFFVITIDLLFATIGYVMTFRWLDADIKSTEPTLLGWLVCLMCYAPFWEAVFWPSYLGYAGEFDWRTWLSGFPWVFFCWGMLVLLTQAANSFSTLALGIRFSNLTYRGLVTSGLYRFTKHPQYIAKWCNWFLVTMPFLSADGFFSALRSMIFLGVIGGIYYLRARTEENHLSNYPEYVAYANWINENGVFRWLAKAVPYLRYSQERVQASGSVVWQKKTRGAD